jgi:cation-transporting ATPase 13A2
MIVIRYQRYRWDGPTADFVPLKPLDGTNGRYFYNEIRPALAHGLTSHRADELLSQHGRNELNVVVPGVFVLLRDEILHPFFIFQIYSVTVWMAEGYYTFALAIFLIAMISIIEALLELRRNLTEISRIARQSCDVDVWRDGKMYHKVSSSILVPGDIVDVTSVTSLPCDLVLLSGGNVIVDESMLTGESIPVVKSPISFPAETHDMKSGTHDVFVSFDNHPSSTLYGATKVVAVKPYGHDGDKRVLAMVIRTGFSTAKGALILSIMYPAPASFKFMQQAWRFLGMLCAITLIGFAITYAHPYPLVVCA